MKKKLLSIVLSLALVITMMPAMALTAFATDNNSQSPTVMLQATTSGSKTIKLSWNEVDNATKYVVYGNKCGKTMKKLATVKSNNYTVKKIGKTKLAAHKFYKFQVVAYNGSSKLATSKAIHFITGKTSGKYANATKITATTAALTLEVGQTSKVGATVKVYKNKKHVSSTHGSKLRYASDNNAVATVSSNGTVKAIAEGTATIYIQDVGGLWCKTVITVKLDRYTVSFNANGHGTAPETMTVVKGEKVIKPADPTAGGYTFDGWFKEASCTNAWNFDTDTVTADTTLYAKWRYIPTPPPAPTEYTVTFDLNGITGTAPEDQTVVSNGKVTKPTDPTFENHTFSGWYKTKNATTGALSDKWDFDANTVTANMTLYAQWQTTISTILETTDSIPTYENFDSTAYDSWSKVPEDAWVTEGGNMAFEGQLESGTIFNLGCCITDNAYYLSLDDTEPFLLCGNTYVWTDGYFGTMTCYMTNGVFTSLTFAGSNQKIVDDDIDYSSLNGTYASKSTCIAAGTMISMAGGEQKAVENIEIGDVVCTFDHETGEVSSAPVCFIWESKNVGNAFTLTFEDDIEVTVIEEHGFYDQEEQKYVFINLQNAEEYIGDHFYNADSNSWLVLKDCEALKRSVDAYAIITSGHLNHMSNGMLSMCDGSVKVLANIFEYDNQIKFDANKKKADIEAYGLTSKEKISEFEGFLESDYDDYHLQYLNVAIGKGLTTWEWIKAFSDYCVANGL